jgi:hypothetical protein
MIRPIKNYTGGKGGAGTYQTIINLIRPHSCYIEPYLGGGSIALYKRRSFITIGNDLDPQVISQWRKAGCDWMHLFNMKALDLLLSINYAKHVKTCIYLDPPYPIRSRKGQKARYNFEMTDQDHVELLRFIQTLPANVDLLLSTYPNPIYQRELKHWYLVEFESVTRGGTKATEHLYLNYDPRQTKVLHDAQHVGKDFREREKYKKKAGRWKANFEKLSFAERQVILTGLMQSFDIDLVAAATTPLAVPDQTIQIRNESGYPDYGGPIAGYETQQVLCIAEAGITIPNGEVKSLPELLSDSSPILVIPGSASYPGRSTIDDDTDRF